MTRATTILVHAEADPSADARMQLAAALAARSGSLLIGLAAGDAMPPVMADPMGGDGVLVGELLEDGRQQMRLELAEAERRFHAACGGHPGLRTEWRGLLGSPAEALAREARAADLLVIGRDSTRINRGIFLSADPGDVLMQCARPVLVVPPGVATLAARSIVLAWKDSREARRAAADALPFLLAAECCLVLEICPAGAAAEALEAARRRLADVAAWLGRHGVAGVSTAALPLTEASVGDTLLLAAETHHSDLIVAGGYGHGRLREWAFGGVTHGLLRHCPKCCLLSH